MWIVKMYGIEFLGETEGQAIDAVYEYEDQEQIRGMNLEPVAEAEWVD